MKACALCLVRPVFVRLLCFALACLAPLWAAAQTAGTLDPLDLNLVGSNVLATAVQPDGKTIIAGTFTSILGVPRSNIARINADGTLDIGFDPKANNSVFNVAVQADGKVLFGGFFTTLQPNGAASATARQHIARVNADGTLDTGFDPKPNNPVYSVAVQADGKVLLGGFFTTLQPNGAASATARQRIARVNADGTLDTGFDPKANGEVYSVAVQADGKVLLAGYFSTLQPNGAASPTARQWIARVNADGTLDTGFDLNANDAVQSVAVQADGKVLLGGFFSTLQPNGAAPATSRNRIARVNADGTLDTGFDPNANDAVYNVAVQADGKVLLAGQFTTLQPNGAASATARQRIARVNADGTLDTGFDPKANNSVYGVAVQADGKVLLGGNFTTLQPNDAASPTTRNRFARLNSDPAYQTLGAVNAAQVLWTRGGAAPEVSGVTFDLSTDGGDTWTSLGTPTRVGTTANWQLTGLSLPATGLLRARGRTTAGYFNGSSGLLEQTAPFDLATATPDPLDLNLNVGGIVYATTVQPDGKTIIAGYFTSVLGVPRSNIARINVDGTLDTGFDPKASSTVYSVAVQADGKVLLGGVFTTLQPNDAASPTARQYIARVNADGTLDTGFDPKANNYVYNVAVQADGRVLLAGQFTTLQPNGAASATARNKIARVNADGTLDEDFDPRASSSVTTVAVQADGKVLLAGDFSTLQPNGAASATMRQYIARLNADGTLDTGFDPKANDSVYSVAVQGDGKVLLGGSFTTLQPNGAPSVTTRRGIARVNGDGTLDTGFDPKTGGTVYSVAVQADGKVLLAGQFTTLQPNGAPSPTARQYIARVNADGTLDPGFDPKAGSTVYSVAVQADGKVLLGGGFTTLQPNGAAAPTTRNRFARLNNDPAIQTLGAVDATQVLWTRGGTAPEVSGVTFELSTDGGGTWTSLGPPSRIGTTANWQLTDLSLPATGLVRARGRITGGQYDSSSGLIEQTAAFDFATATPTLFAPANGILTTRPVRVTFTLPEAALPGSVTLAFGAHVLTLATSQESAGAHIFYFDPATPTATAAVASGAAIPDGTYTVTLSYQDALGNPAATVSSIGVLLDITAPTLNLPGNLTAEATSAAGASVIYTASASDPGGSGVATSSFLPASGSTFPLGTTTVNANATDRVGNTATGSFTVTVQDTTAPVVAAHGNVTAEATSAAGAVVNYAAGDATDAVGVTEITYSQASGTTFPLGVTTVTITAKDAANHTGTGTFTVTVQDTTAPVITLNGTDPVTVERGTAYTDAGATATDLVSGSVAVETSGTVDVNISGDYTVTYSATDAAGNQATKTRTVQVRDTAAPGLSAVTIASSNANTTVRARAGDVVTVSFAATEGIQTPSVTIGSSMATVNHVSDNRWTASVTAGLQSGPIGFRIVYSDFAGNAGIPVIHTTDGSAVVLDNATLPGSILAPLDRGYLGLSSTVTFHLPETAFPGSVMLRFPKDIGWVSLVLAASFETAGDHTFTFSPSDPVGTSNGAIVSGEPLTDRYAPLVLYYRDLVGNQEVPHATDFFVTVDTVPPSLAFGYLGIPADAKRWAKAGDEVAVQFHVTGGPVNSYTLGLGGLAPVIVQRGSTNTNSFTHLATVTSEFPEGWIAYTVQLHDRAGNESEMTTGVLGVAVDHTAPVLTVPADVTAEATNAGGATVNFIPTATDNLDPAPTVTASPASGQTFPPGPTTVQVEAVDAAGNRTTGSFTVTVVDTTAPVASVGPIALVAGPAGTAVLGDQRAQVTVSDAATAAGGVGIEQTPAAATVLGLGRHPVSFTVTDAAGNSVVVQTTATVAFARPEEPETTPSKTAGPVVKKAATGAPIPAGTTLPDTATLAEFFTPALSDARQLVARATVLDGRKKLGAIYVEDGAGTGALPAYQTGPVRDEAGTEIEGVTFKSFVDPVTAPGGAIAFAAKLAGVKGTVDDGVWSDVFSATPLEVHRVLAEGAPVPVSGLNGETLKAVTSLSLRDGQLLALVQLGSVPAAKVTAKNDTALILLTGAGTGTVLLREGVDLDGFPGVPIKSFSVLQPAPGSAGQGRWHADNAVLAKVTLTDKTVLLVSIANDTTVTPLLSTTDAPADAIAGFDPDAKWKSFGLPAQSFAVAAALTPKSGTVTAKNDAVILASTDGAAWTVAAREGDLTPLTAPDEGPRYATFLDPVANDAGALAFIATLQGTGVTAKNKSALFTGPAEALTVAARLGDQAPDETGTLTDTRWSKFLNHALPGGPDAGAIFLAETTGGDTTPKTKLGLWAVDSSGHVRRLLRAGTGTPAIKTFTLLDAPRGTFGAARSYNATGSVAVLATFTDGTKALLRIDIP